MPGCTFFPQSVRVHYLCSGPISADPICPQPRLGGPEEQEGGAAAEAAPAARALSPQALETLRAQAHLITAMLRLEFCAWVGDASAGHLGRMPAVAREISRLRREFAVLERALEEVASHV